MKWFRFYHETLDDPKVQLLSDRRFRQWVNLLCVANQSSERGVLPGVEAIAFRLRETLDETLHILADFEKAGLIDHCDGDTYQPHNWDRRQFKSDNVTERVEKHRERASIKEENVSSADTETLQETFSEAEDRGQIQSTETDTTTGVVVEAAACVRETAEILVSASWIGDELGGVVKGVHRSFQLVPKFDISDAPIEAEKFVRWHSGSGRKKRNPPDDWYRAWLNWIKKAINDTPPAPARGNGAYDPTAIWLEWAENPDEQDDIRQRHGPVIDVTAAEER